MKEIRKHRNVILRITDIIIIALAYYFAEVIVNEKFLLTNEITVTIVRTIILAIIIYEVMLQLCKTYKNITRYENGKDYLIYVFACLVSYLTIVLLKLLFKVDIVSLKVNSVAALIIPIALIGYRVIIRSILNGDYPGKSKNKTKTNVLIIGAGDAAKILLGTIRTTLKDSYNVVGLIDDNKNKVNYAISGNQIIGTRKDIPQICKENGVELILYTISNIEPEQRKEMLNICYETGCKVRVLPGAKDIIKGDSDFMSNFRDVEIEDLLGRDTIQLDNQDIEELIKDHVVLVTGGGGSIGSELCRQVMKYNPQKLVMVDIYENNLYDIEQELRREYPEKEVAAIVASVRDKKRLSEIFKEHKPYLVFHAAAHKHVPLMETSPLEAIKNNVFGTYNTVDCADKYGVKRFILISTDKAVNPTNIMGATKRLCEMIIQAKAKVSKTEYAAVRFGNVLGSNGSVIPLFKKQIAKGGPVTVTHKEITRFFMTIPEAVSLVLQAMSYAQGGEIFVLDMGEPVKIYDMARKLIKLSGYEPDVDMEIKVTGLRPGEKLYEELLMAEEGLEKTAHEKIRIAEPSDITMEDISKKLSELSKVLKTCNNEQKEIIKNTIKEIVPTYKENKEVNKQKLEEVKQQEEAKNEKEIIEQKEEITEETNRIDDLKVPKQNKLKASKKINGKVKTKVELTA